MAAAEWSSSLEFSETGIKTRRGVETGSGRIETGNRRHNEISRKMLTIFGEGPHLEIALLALLHVKIYKDNMINRPSTPNIDKTFAKFR